MNAGWLMVPAVWSGMMAWQLWELRVCWARGAEEALCRVIPLLTVIFVHVALTAHGRCSGKFG